MMVGAILEMFSIGLVMPLVGALTNGEFYSKNIEYLGTSKEEAIIYVFVLLIVIYSIKSAYLIAFSWWQTKYIYEIQTNISSQLLNAYLDRDFEFYLNIPSAEAIRNIATESAELINKFMLPVMLLSSEALVTILISAFLFYFYPLQTFTLILVMIFFVIFIYKPIKKNISVLGAQRQEFEALKIGSLQDIFSCIKEIKLLNKKEYFKNQFFMQQTKVSDANRGFEFLQQIPKILLEIFAILAITIAMFLVFLLDESPEKVIMMLAVFIAATVRLLPSFNRMMNSWNAIKYSDVVLRLIKNELIENKLIQPTNLVDKKIIFNEKNCIQIVNLCFAYKNTITPVINHLNLTIAKGESIGIIGESGSGKSTFLNLLLGLLEPTSGQIIINGNLISSYGDILNNKIGYVSQHINLINSTIKNNIALGVCDEEISPERINRCIEVSQLYHLVDSYSKGVETMVGEAGARLSGGQRQRIGIARAMYNDPEVLIFDEATSALDEETEKNFMRSIEEFRRLKTLIIISHKASTLRGCDRVFALKSGSLIKV